MGAETVKMTEFKCFDCDQVFLLPGKGPSKYCPKCGSERVQNGGGVNIQILEEPAR